jgi:hypothetical protein
MSELPTTTAGLAKRAREEQEKEGKEVDQAVRIKTTWEYLEEVKKLQSLEIEIELLRKKLKMKEARFPDLKALRGTVDHLSEDKFYEVELDSKKRIVAGKSLEEATEKYKKKLDLERKNKEKQKAASKVQDPGS